jgi:hypothetical protein
MVVFCGATSDGTAMKTLQVADSAALETEDANGFRLSFGHVLVGLVLVSALGWMVLIGVARTVMQLIG